MLRTDTNNSESLVDQDGVICHLASGPVGAAVAQPLGKRDRPSAERREILGGVGVRSKDSAPVGSQEGQQPSQARERPEEASGVRGSHVAEGAGWRRREALDAFFDPGEKGLLREEQAV